jgi:SGNH domain (fused to AT3 domains)
LGYLQYRFVEQPYRSGGTVSDRRFLWHLVIASLIQTTPIPAYFLWRQSDRPRTALSFVTGLNTGLDSSSVCDQDDKFDGASRCRLPGVPRVALWGDSYAMHWAAGLASILGGKGVVQMTKSDCGPLLGVSYINQSHQKPWAQSCIRFNDSALKFVSDTPTIDTVVLASVFNQYVDGENRQQLVGNSLQPVSVEISAERFLETISALRKLGKRVIVLAPPPSVTFDIGACLERKSAGLPVFVGGRIDCNFGYSDYLAAKRNVIELLKIVEGRTDTEIVWPEKLTCNAEARGGVCVTQVDRIPLYRDSGHLTSDGSILLAQMLRLDMILRPSP